MLSAETLGIYIYIYMVMLWLGDRMEWSLDFSLDAFSYILLFVFWLHCSVCRFLVAWPGIKPVPPVVS